MRPRRRDEGRVPEPLAEVEESVGEADAGGHPVPADRRPDLDLASHSSVS